MYRLGSNMYSYGTIMNCLGATKVQRCHFEGTALVTSCFTSKYFFFVLVHHFVLRV